MTYRVQDYAIVVLLLPIVIPVSVFIGALLAVAFVLSIAIHLIREAWNKPEPEQG